MDDGINGYTERSYNIFRWFRADWGRYAQADPIMDKLIAEGLSPFGGGRTEVYGYSRENPHSYVDPLGLKTSIGPAPQSNNCDYYERVCKQSGCSYQCNVAPKYCKSMGSLLNIFDTKETKLCIQECLIFKDAQIRNGTDTSFVCEGCQNCPGKSGCITENCITKYHKYCFSRCDSRSWWPALFPSAGPLFPGRGC